MSTKIYASQDWVEERLGEVSGGEATIPTKLPNPNALTFTGAVNATYDGSEEVSVEIPKGGDGSEKEWKLIDHFVVEKSALSYDIPLQEGATEYGIYWGYTDNTSRIPQRSIIVDSSLSQYGVMFRSIENNQYFIRVYKGPSSILVFAQNTTYSAPRYQNGGTFLGSGTDFPAMRLTTNIDPTSQEIYIYWR